MGKGAEGRAGPLQETGKLTGPLVLSAGIKIYAGVSKKRGGSGIASYAQGHAHTDKVQWGKG